MNQKKYLALPALAAIALWSVPSVAFATPDPSISQAGEDIGAITTTVSTLSTALPSLIGALLGASLLAWGGWVAIKALRRGFR